MFEEDERIECNEYQFDANWSEKIEDELAKLVVEKGEFIKKLEDTGTTWYTLYKHEGQYYVGLCDFNDLWELSEEDQAYFL